MNQFLSDDEAIKKANSMQWFDNQAGMVERFNPHHRPKQVYQPKRDTGSQQNKRNIEDLSFDECSERYAEAVERLATYQHLPSVAKETMKDSIVSTAKYLTALRIHMKRIATPEEMTLVAYVERLKSKNRKLKALANDNSVLKKRLKEFQHDQQTQTFIHLKKLVKDTYGESAFLSLIQEASKQAQDKIQKIKQDEAQ